MNKRRVKVTKLPEYSQGSEVRMGGDHQGGFFSPDSKGTSRDTTTRSFIKPVPRDEANIEAELGETMITPMGDDAQTRMLPKTFQIGGKKHYKGGTPLNVPAGTFIFSDHLKEKNEEMHEFFGKKPKKSGYTYADLSKPFMINKDIERLVDDTTDKISKETAELNIQNKLNKLSFLSLLQESNKAFQNDQGEFEIPEVGSVYLESTGLDLIESMQPYVDQFTQAAMSEQAQGPMKMKLGGNVPLPKFSNGGGVQGLKPGHRVNRETGVIYDENGREVGFISYDGTPARTKKVKRSSIPANSIVIKRSDYDTEQEYIAARNEAFLDAKDKPVYVQGENGRYRKVYYESKGFEPYKGELYESTFNKDQEVANQYHYLEQEFSKDALKKEMQQRAIAALKNPDNIRGISKAQVESMIKKLEDDPDLAYKQFMAMQKRNYALLAHGKDVATFRNAPDNSGISNADFKKAYEEIGIEAPKTKEEAALQQAAYIGYSNLVGDYKGGKINNADLSKILRNLDVLQVGKSDDELAGVSGAGMISKIDGIYTNTTAGEIAKVNAPYTLGEKDLEDSQIEIDPITGKHRPSTLGWREPDYRRLQTARKFLTDDVKEQPWAAIPPLTTPEVYLESPQERAFNERGLVAQTENLLSSYATPGVLAAGSSALTGAGNIGSYISQTNARNIDRLNQGSLAATDMINQYGMSTANIATGLHDKRAIVNEKGRQYARDAQKLYDDVFDWGWNKASEIAAINAGASNYMYEPWTGDPAKFIGGDPLTPTDPNEQMALANKVEEYTRRFPNIQDARVILDMAKTDLGIPTQPQVPAQYQYNTDPYYNYPG
jgi:hypothetical protein